MYSLESPLFPSAGESGLGKSTLINSLFLTDLYKDRKVPNAEGEMTSVAEWRKTAGKRTVSCRCIVVRV